MHTRIYPSLLVVLIAFVLASCGSSRKSSRSANSTRHMERRADAPAARPKTFVQPLDVDRAKVISYAKTLLGTPYKYASSDPRNGLDCSGFVYNVLGKFNIASPRRSVDFTNEGRTIALKDARPADLILFTGSDNSSGVVGHMGFITENKNGKVFFIHSASGKNIGVIINELRGYYVDHFVKVISIFR